MITSRWSRAVLACAVVLLAAASESAQDVAADPAMGGGGGGRRGGVRIAVQGRLDLLNTLGNETGIDVGGGFDVNGSLLPVITGGLRFDSLFLGAGLGFYGYSYTDCNDDSCDSGASHSGFGWSFVPTVTFDILREPEAAGYLLGSLTL